MNGPILFVAGVVIGAAAMIGAFMLHTIFDGEDHLADLGDGGDELTAIVDAVQDDGDPLVEHPCEVYQGFRGWWYANCTGCGDSSEQGWMWEKQAVEWVSDHHADVMAEART